MNEGWEDYKVARWCAVEMNQDSGMFWQVAICKALRRYVIAVLWALGSSEPGQRKTNHHIAKVQVNTLTHW